MARSICSMRRAMAMTRAPKADLARRTNIKPIGPRPITATASAGRTPLSSRPRRAQASGSTKAASIIEICRDEVRILVHDTGRHTNEFGVSAIVEKQIFTEILLAAQAEETVIAGSGVSGDHAIPHLEPGDLFSHSGDIAGHFVTKEGWGLDHARVIAAAEDLYIGAASKRGA